MINLIIGIAVGAVFSKFWISVYNAGEAFIKSKLPANKVAGQ